METEQVIFERMTGEWGVEGVCGELILRSSQRPSTKRVLFGEIWIYSDGG